MCILDKLHFESDKYTSQEVIEAITNVVATNDGIIKKDHDFVIERN